MVDLIRRRPATLVFAIALVLGVSAIAYAHATLVSAEPAANSHLDASPPRVRLVFSERLEVGLARLSLTAPDGHALKLTPAGDPHDVHAMIAPVGGLAPGSYRVNWHVVSDDGHPVDGSYGFTVGNVPTASEVHTADVEITDTTVWGPAVAGAPLIPAAARGVALLSLMALTGLLLFAALPRAAGDPESIAQLTLARRLSVATIVLLALSFAAWAFDISAGQVPGFDQLGAMLSTSGGRVEMWRAALALLAAWALWLARRPRIALFFAAGAVIASGDIGHPAAIQPLLSVPAVAIHLLALSVWIGGLLWLVTTERGNAAAFARGASRVSSAALIAVVLVVLSGLVQTLIMLPAIVDLFRSAYGLVVCAKIAGLLVLIAFGAYHRARVMPRLAADGAASVQLISSVRRELIVMAIVVLLGGLLAYVPPPMAPMPGMDSTSTH